MKFSTLAVLPVFALSTSALVLPVTEHSYHAVTGSINSTAVEAADHTIRALQSEYEKLEVLKYQLFELHHEVLKQEHEIFVLINKDFTSCNGVKCYLQTALKKAPDFLKLFKSHFRHHPNNATASAWDCLRNGKSAPGDVLPLAIDAEKPSQHTTSPDPSRPFDDDSALYPLPPPPPPFEAEPFHHPPSPPSNHPDYKSWKPNPNKPATSSHHDHKGPHGFHMPHPAPRHRHFRLILAVAGFTITTLILAILFKATRIYCSNPRVRAECAAITEERRTRREYKRAACRYRFRQVLSRFCPRRRSGNSSNDEEKQAVLQQASINDTADHIVGADINSLGRAHEIVGRLMRAEEGRMQYEPALLPRPTRLEEPTSSTNHSVRSLNTMTTLPPYTPPPPRYSQELSRDMEVVDGFRYTPTYSEATITSSASSFILNDDDLCTESSVVDCRSRMSMDTDSIYPPQTREPSRNRKSLDLASDRFRGQFD